MKATETIIGKVFEGKIYPEGYNKSIPTKITKFKIIDKVRTRGSDRPVYDMYMIVNMETNQVDSITFHQLTNCKLIS
jgi:hypothetical protein